MMYDIEFLADAAPKLERHVIYFYQAQSRVLRKRVRERVLELFQEQGATPTGVQPKELQAEIGSPSLFSTALICDLEELPRHQIGDLIAIVLDQLLTCEQHLFLLAPYDPPQKFVARECTVIIEPIVTTLTMQMVFDFCLRESRALRTLRLTNERALKEYLATELGQGLMSFWDFRRLFEHLAITAIDENTGRFMPSLVRKDRARTEEISLGLALEAFVQSGTDEGALREILVYVGRFLHQRHKGTPALISYIHMRTRRVLGLSGADMVLRRRALAWSALLLAWDARLLAGPFENALLQLCQTYRELRPEQGLLPALEGRWREVAHLIGRYRPADNEGRPQLTRLLDLMASELGALGAGSAPLSRWLQRLGSLLSAPTADPAKSVATTPNLVPADWQQRDALRSFGKVLGQDQALQLLTKHLDPKAGQHIVFAGPPGVGKRALARLYAMGLWCKQGDAAGSPCGACESCLGVLANATIDYFEVDFAQSSVGVASSVESTTVVPLQEDYRINVLLNIERISRAQLDQLLKVLERVYNAVFLFSVADVALMNAAVLSRCKVVPVLALAHDAAVGRLLNICAREQVFYEPDALRVIAAVGRYRAGALLRCLAAVAAAGSLTLTRARDVFDLTWVPPVVAQLSFLLEGRKGAASDASNDLTDEFVEHAQIVLTAVDLRCKGLWPEASHGLHPALMCLPSDWDAPLHKSVKRRATETGVPAQRIWDAFVDAWMNMDFHFRSDFDFITHQVTE